MLGDIFKYFLRDIFRKIQSSKTQLFYCLFLEINELAIHKGLLNEPNCYWWIDETNPIKTHLHVEM